MQFGSFLISGPIMIVCTTIVICLNIGFSGLIGVRTLTLGGIRVFGYYVQHDSVCKIVRAEKRDINSF